MKRTEIFSIKITKEEKKMLKNIREKHNINTSSFLRSCILKKYNDLNSVEEE